jgi:hypothetical protein
VDFADGVATDLSVTAAFLLETAQGAIEFGHGVEIFDYQLGKTERDRLHKMLVAALRMGWVGRSRLGLGRGLSGNPDRCYCGKKYATFCRSHHYWSLKRESMEGALGWPIN